MTNKQIKPTKIPTNICYKYTKIPTNVETKSTFDFDILIGCSAIAHGCTLVTGNLRHLQRLDGIRLECWCG